MIVIVGEDERPCTEELVRGRLVGELCREGGTNIDELSSTDEAT